MMKRREILEWLREDDPRALARLERAADRLRREHVGDEVHLRGLIEFSNHCDRSCAYCGLRAGNRGLKRYRMSQDEIVACALHASRLGYGTVVLQSGEDHGFTVDWMAEVIRGIKSRTGLAVTLSLGERADRELLAWRQAGADRYLLRFETSNRSLYERIHPAQPGQDRDRLAMLRGLRQMGYEVGSGVMVGIPGQTYEDLATDIELFRELDLDMIGVGPFIPHPRTPLGRPVPAWLAPSDQQVPGDVAMTCKVIALARLVCPDANIPSTTALATLARSAGREPGLAWGANVIMPNLTPPRYRLRYDVYPGKATTHAPSRGGDRRIRAVITANGRTVGTGRGDSPNWLRRESGRREAG